MNTIARNHHCPSELTLERLRQGEIEGAPLEAHVRSCLACRRLVEELAAPPPPLALAPRRRRWWAQTALAGAAVGALVTVTVLVLLEPPHASTFLCKGGPWSLQVFARRPDGQVGRLDPGASVSPGDRLRFQVSSCWEPGEVAILDVEARGEISPVVPPSGATIPVAAGRTTLLDGAVELDGSLGRERLLLLACRRAVALSDLLAAARQALARAGGDPLRMGRVDRGCAEETLWINKVPR
jgi:hypothetical protein